MPFDVPCQVHGCDRTEARFAVFVPADKPRELDRLLELARWRSQIGHHRVAERLFREAEREYGVTLMWICDFHLELVRTEKLEMIGKAGQRLVPLEE